MRIHIVSLVSLMALTSCTSCSLTTNDEIRVSGTVTYLVSSSEFAVADNIRYSDQEGDLHDTGRVTLPWGYSFDLVKVSTYSMRPANFAVEIGSMTNVSGGTLTTKCSFSKNYRNGDLTKTYPAGIAIRQSVNAELYPNDF